MDKEKREPNKGDNTTGLVDKHQNKELWDLLARRFNYTDKGRILPRGRENQHQEIAEAFGKLPKDKRQPSELLSKRFARYRGKDSPEITVE